MRIYNLISTQRFETIFHHRFNTSFSKDAEKYWCFASENVPDFYALTLSHEDLIAYDKKWEGTWPEMLYALDELFHVFRGVGANDIDGQCVVAHEILSLASLHCMVWWGKPIDPCKTRGTVSTLLDVHGEKGLEQLTWAVYDGVLLTGDLPELQGQHNWVQIITGTNHLMYRGNRDSEHWPHAPPHHLMLHRLQEGPHYNTGTLHTLPPGTPRTPALWSTVNVPPRSTSFYSAEGVWPPPWTTVMMRRKMDPSISSMPAEFSLGVPGKKQKCPCIRCCIAHPPRMVKLTPCGELPSDWRTARENMRMTS